MIRLRSIVGAAGMAAIAASATPVQAADIHVMASGGFTAAYKALLPGFERETGHRVVSAYGASMGGAPDSIPSRLERGEPADVLILAGSALDRLAEAGEAVPGSRVDLADSVIGMVVREGAPRPDIGSVEALRQALLSSASFAYSASASGTYIANDMLPELGIADQVKDKARRIESERVATVVARGDAELGFQQISELLPEPGVDFVGPLPDGVQRVTTFSAGIADGAAEPEAGRQLIAYLSSKEAAPVIAETGLDPLAAP
ncbi:substrate-binding domain-containing protein [Marinivivus vitaminiproducens]|uniref:substrate-binding domain-containing protein n=1 Tax=Marinivivus vitaminiproducens TaxID=3035935 RepID=UPI0027A26D08|nr:substrate-binding domain-containing protein [Geminicoccaceae bacterium SCSIO 64248]